MSEREQADRTTDRIVVECDLPEPPAKVWRALTEPELVAAWLLPPDSAVECRVLDAEPHRRLDCSWYDPAVERNTVVSFELTETEAGGTRLRIVHADAVAPETKVVMLASARRRRPSPAGGTTMRLAA